MMKEAQTKMRKEKGNSWETKFYKNDFSFGREINLEQYNLAIENYLAQNIYSATHDFSHLTLGSWQKLLSARALLEEIGASYQWLLQTNPSTREVEGRESQFFLNSNLLYLIAATDGNEDTVGHSQLVAHYALVLARQMGLTQPHFLLDLERGALLHDIGKIAIPETILRKPGALTKTEKNIIKEHPLVGYELIKNYEFLKKAADIVLYHHERYDGQGYPYGLKGEEIPLAARIFSVADTLDAITSDRPYRRGQSFLVACEEIEKEKGSQFDPQVVEAFFEIKEKTWLEIKYSLRKKQVYLSTTH